MIFNATDQYGIRCRILRRDGIMIEVMYADLQVKVYHHTRVFPD